MVYLSIMSGSFARCSKCQPLSFCAMIWNEGPTACTLCGVQTTYCCSSSQHTQNLFEENQSTTKSAYRHERSVPGRISLLPSKRIFQSYSSSLISCAAHNVKVPPPHSTTLQKFDTSYQNHCLEQCCTICYN